MGKKENEKIALQISFNSIIVNVILSTFKLFAGIFAHSFAMISDALHSASDVLSTIIVIIGVRFASKEDDTDHPYGHERMECVAAIILATILLSTGIGIGYAGVQKIIFGDYGELSIPGMLALFAASLSIVVKEWMYWYTRAGAKKIASSVLMADAWHHRSDAFSSIGSFAGILGARLGFPILDPLVSVVICIFIVKAAFDIFMDAIGKMTDKSCDDEVIKELRKVILEQSDVLGIDEMKTRLFADKVYVDVEICADGNISLHQAHDISEQVHDAVEENFPRVKHCMVHVNPVNCENSESS